MKFDLNDFFSKEELIELLETLKLKINEKVIDNSGDMYADQLM